MELVRLHCGGMAWREFDLSPGERFERRVADADDAELLALIDQAIGQSQSGLLSDDERLSLKAAVRGVIAERRDELRGRLHEIEDELYDLDGERDE